MIRRRTICSFLIQGLIIDEKIVTCNEWYNISTEDDVQSIEKLFQPGQLIRRDVERNHFKSNLISLYFVRDLTAREAALGALLGRVLTFSSQEYPSMKAISDQEDDLYGVVFYFDSDKYGDELVVEYKMIYPNYQLLPIEDDLSPQAMAFYASLLGKPMLIGGRFDQAVFDTEKANLLEELASIRKDPAGYAYRKCNEVHFRDSQLGVYKYGDEASLEQISNQDLVDYYNDLFQSSQIYCYRHGAFKDSFNRISSPPDRPGRLPHITEKRFLEEERTVHQSILVQAYQTDIDQADPEAQAAMMFSQILGGDSNSVLFRVIREKLGYCYHIETRYDKYRGVMFISTGYHEANHSALVKQIEQVVLAMQSGEISDEDFAIAKLEAIQSLKSLADRQATMLDYIFIQDLFGKHDSVADRVRQLEKMTKQAVIEAGRRFELTTSFHLRGTR